MVGLTHAINAGSNFCGAQGPRIDRKRRIVRQINPNVARPGTEIPRAAWGTFDPDPAAPGTGTQRPVDSLDLDRPGPGPEVNVATDRDNLNAA